MIGARVNVVSGWGAEIARRINAKVGPELQAAVERGAEEASRVARQRHRTGRMEEMEILDARGTTIGWEAAFRSRAFYAGFQSRGTLASHRGKVSAGTLRRRQSASGWTRFGRVSGSGGIKPLHFLEDGAAVAKKDLIKRLNRL